MITLDGAANWLAASLPCCVQMSVLSLAEIGPRSSVDRVPASGAGDESSTLSGGTNIAEIDNLSFPLHELRAGITSVADQQLGDFQHSPKSAVR